MPFDQILEFPLSKLFQFTHCSAVISGMPTVWANRMPAEEAEYQEAVNRLRARQKKSDTI